MPKNKTILNIYILEDNPDYLTFIQETVQQYLLIEELPAKIRLATTSATELLAAVDWSAINDSIFLLDIELGRFSDKRRRCSHSHSEKVILCRYPLHHQPCR